MFKQPLASAAARWVSSSPTCFKQNTLLIYMPSVCVCVIPCRWNNNSENMFVVASKSSQGNCSCLQVEVSSSCVPVGGENEHGRPDYSHRCVLSSENMWVFDFTRGIKSLIASSIKSFYLCKMWREEHQPPFHLFKKNAIRAEMVKKNESRVNKVIIKSSERQKIFAYDDIIYYWWFSAWIQEAATFAAASR